MVSLANRETSNMEERQFDVENPSRAARTQWLLESPNPPGLWHTLVGTIKENMQFSCIKEKTPSKRALSILQGVFPILKWAGNYNLSMFRSDLLAGLTLASLCIPQSIGYATLARLDPEYGLYSSVLPPLIYAIMGSSRELAIGPVAVVSLLIASMVQNLQDPVTNPVAYRNLVFTVTFFAGVFQASFGFFRLGFLVDYLSHAAVVGFMGGAAIVIGLQQLNGLLGISHSNTKTDVVSVLESVVGAVRHPWHPLNFVIGCSFLIFLLAARFIGKRNKKFFWFPAVGPLLSVVLSTLIVFLTKADKHGVKIVKHIKGGINPTSVKALQLRGPHVGQTAKIGLISSIVALTEAIAVGRSFSSIKGYRLDGNKEMMAIGCMNIVGSLTSCYVTTGSFSRTAVNVSAGCQTVVSNIVMALAVFLSLEFFTRLLYYTPVTILASIIISALPGLIDVNEAIHIWKVDKLDFLACIGAFFGVLFASVEIGLLIAIGISFGKILLHSIRPSTQKLGRLPRTEIFCDVAQYPMAMKTPGLLVFRINSGGLCFANANFIKERIMRWVSEENQDTKGHPKARVQAVVLDMSNVMTIDTSGILAIEELHKNLIKDEIQVAMANLSWHVMHKLKVAKFVDKIGTDWFFISVAEAVDACQAVKLCS